MDVKHITRDYIQDFFRLGDAEQDINLLNYVMSHLEYKEFANDSTICYAGEEADAMYFVEAGTVIVRGRNSEILDELKEGRHFGEYATITGDIRMSDIQTRGRTKVFKLDKEVLQYLVGQKPDIYGLFLKNAQSQSAEQYRKLVKLLSAKRGSGFGRVKKKLTLPALFINYYIVFMVFLLALLFAPKPTAGLMHPFWLCSPIVFMVAYLVITQRAMETLALSTMYIMILLSKFNFVGAFSRHLLNTVGGAVDIILIVLLMGSLTRLFSASGSINALKYVVQKKIRSAKGTFLTAFLSMVLIAIDEYLSILINGACFTPLVDAKRIPREKSAMIMGISPGALCVLSPISITGIYLTGIIALSTGQSGLFLETIRYNFGALIMIVFVLLLIIGRLPFVGGLKQAQLRVDLGGDLWPDGTEVSEKKDEQSHGRLVNLILPVLVLIASSIITGTLEAGVFRVNVLYGLCITLIFVFLLYCFQQYMTPEQFFKHLVYGVESMVAPIAIFIVGKAFANGMDMIGFSAWLGRLVHSLIQGQVWLLPPIIFCVCVLIGALFDNPWAMYAIGIPIAANFALSSNGNMPLYLGAVCAAGVVANELAPGDIFFIGPTLGVNPLSYYRAKLPYIIAIASLTFFAYAAAGYFKL